MKKTTVIVVAVALWIGISAAAEKTPVKNLPKIVVLGSLAKVYEPVRFNHAEHVSTAGGCSECHHQHGQVQVKTCLECHPVESAVFKKNLAVDKLRPCGDCHSASERPGTIASRGLKDAYHQACFKCHKSDVGSGVKNLKGCTEMCHVLKAPEKRGEQ